MKMIVAIVSDEDTDAIIKLLLGLGLTVTQINSSGGFLRQNRNTLIVGIEDHRVDEAIQTIRAKISPTIEPMLRHAFLFVLDVEHFEQL